MASSLLQHDGGALLRDRSQCIAASSPVSFLPMTHQRWWNAGVDVFPPVGLSCLVQQAVARVAAMWRRRPAANDGWAASVTSPWDEGGWEVWWIRWHERVNDPMASPVFWWNASRYVSIHVPVVPSDTFHVRQSAHVTRGGISVRKGGR